jgi:hypothetical protein
LLITDISLDAVNPIFDIPHQGKIHAVIEQDRTQSFFNQEPGRNGAVNAHPTSNQHVHIDRLSNSFYLVSVIVV